MQTKKKTDTSHMSKSTHAKNYTKANTVSLVLELTSQPSAAMVNIPLLKMRRVTMVTSVIDGSALCTNARPARE